MLTPPQRLTQLTEQYGPHLHDTPPGGWQGRGEPDRLVKTHCCFCGVQCGIQLKVISGDHPATVSALALAAGIPNAGRYIAGPDLAQREGADFDTAVAESAVFGRITPDQKAAIIDSLKSNGRYVAMTGDGVNDVPAMKRAHLSIAMRAGHAFASRSARMALRMKASGSVGSAIST